MASAARSIRPFVSQALAQKPLASACRAGPAFRFPRGTRSFSQSPLGELFHGPSWSYESPAAFCGRIGDKDMVFMPCWALCYYSLLTTSSIGHHSSSEEVHRVARMDRAGQRQHWLVN